MQVNKIHAATYVPSRDLKIREKEREDREVVTQSAVILEKDRENTSYHKMKKDESSTEKEAREKEEEIPADVTTTKAKSKASLHIVA